MAIGLQTSGLSSTLTVKGLLIKSFKTARIIGDGETPTTSELTDALDLLNGLVEQANLDKLLGLYQTEIVFTLTPNRISYTIGPATASPDVVAVRPVEILSAFSRRLNIDLPIQVTHQKTDYDRIQLKTLAIAGWEQVVYYQASYPAGTAYFYMQPLDSLTSVHLTVTANIGAFAQLTDVVDLAPGYRTWMQYKLAQRLAPEFGMVFTDQNMAILTEAESALQRNNIKPFPLASNETVGLGSPSSGNYNVYSDGSRR